MKLLCKTFKSRVDELDKRKYNHNQFIQGELCAYNDFIKMVTSWKGAYELLDMKEETCIDLTKKRNGMGFLPLDPRIQKEVQKIAF